MTTPLQATKPQTNNKTSPAKQKIDWVAAQKFYLENPTKSYKDVAEQFEVGVHAVEMRAAKEGWTSRRQAVGEKVIAAVEGEIIAKNIDRNEAHTIGARNLQGLIQKKIEIAVRQIKKQEKELGPDRLDEMTVYDTGQISEKRLADLANAYVTAVNLERVTLNLPTSVERKEITGRNGKDLFGTDDHDKFIGIISNTLAALDQGAARTNDTPDNTPSEG